jgi:hypothetical protein
MTALPSASSFTGSGVTEADFKMQLTNLISYLTGLLDTPGTTISALQKLGALAYAVLSKSAAYTVVATDRGKLIDCTTGTWTLSLTAAATLGSFAFAVRNSGSGTITIDPNLTEQIDGAPTLSLAAGESCIVICDGSKFITVGRSSASSAVDTQTFTSSGTWTKPTGAKLAIVELWGGGGGGGRGSNANGGGGGGYGCFLLPLASLGATETVTIGAGGTGRTGSNGDGTAGGDSTFGSHAKATGGVGGYNTDANNPSGGYMAPLAATSKVVHAELGGSGGRPTYTVSTNATTYSGGGGGQTSGAGTTGQPSTFGGAGGKGGDSSPLPTAGAQPGGGGGGGSGVDGMNGGAGKCVVTCY